MYNIRPLYTYRLTGSVIGPDNSGFAKSYFGLTDHYYDTVAPWLEYGVVVFVLSGAFKFFAFVVIYRLSSSLLSSSSAAIASTVLFMMSTSLSTMHGLSQIGLWSPQVISTVSLSTLCSLLGLYCYTRSRYFLAGISFAVSIQFHPLHGTGVLAWLAIGILFVFGSKQRSIPIGKAIVALLPIVVSIFGIFLESTTSISSPVSSITEWYSYLEVSDPDDVFLNWTYSVFGFGLVPLLLGATLLSLTARTKTILDYLLIGSSCFAFLGFILEMLHSVGVFFGDLSTYFLAMQFRRGVWIPALLSLIVVVGNWQRIVPMLRKHTTFSIAGTAIIVYLVPTVLLVTMFFLVLVVASADWRMRAFAATSLIVATSFLEFPPTLSSLPKMAIIFCLVLISSALVERGNSISLQPVLIGIATLGILANTYIAISIGQPPQGFRALTSEGPFEKMDIKYAINTYSGGGFDPLAGNCIATLGHSEGEVSGLERIQIPPTKLTYWDFIYYQKPLVYSRFSIGHALLSMTEYDTMKISVTALLGPEPGGWRSLIAEQTNKAELLEAIEERYLQLNANELRKLRATTKLRYYLIREERRELDQALICVGDLYFIYDLSLL